MPFEIIILKIGTETKKVGGTWEKIDETFFSAEDMERLTWMDQQKKSQAEVRDLKKPVMGYTLMIEKEIPFEKEIFKQLVDDMDLPIVIAAINSLKK